MPASTVTQFFESKEAFPLREGSTLPGLTIAYETWGTLNADASNAVLLFHALSGSHHAAGRNPSIPGIGDLWQPELHEGWWENIIGPDKAIDTTKLFVICPNYLGGCYGSTGPASINPETGKRWGSSFPSISASDQVNAAALLLDHLGITTLHAVVGPSVGGLISLSFATRLPDRVRHVINIASGFRTTVLNRLILFEQILAIENDPNFNGGDFYETKPPFYGLALARMISHKTFVHLDSFENRARQDVIQPDDVLAWYRVRDQFQSYMLHQGKNSSAASTPTPTCASSICGRVTTPSTKAMRRHLRNSLPGRNAPDKSGWCSPSTRISASTLRNKRNSSAILRNPACP